MSRKTAKKINYTYAVGRRKTSSARVRLFRGRGESTVNAKPIAEYFPGAVNRDFWTKPFRVLDVADKFYFTAKVTGGGPRGQIDAVTHAVSKAFAKLDPIKFRKPLKIAGLLTRDARTRERRKVATGGKARRKKQSPKR